MTIKTVVLVHNTYDTYTYFPDVSDVSVSLSEGLISHVAAHIMNVFHILRHSFRFVYCKFIPYRYLYISGIVLPSLSINNG